MIFSDKPYWTRRTHVFKRDEFICSKCKFVTNKPYKQCPRCGEAINKVKSDTNWVDEMADYDDIFE